VKASGRRKNEKRTWRKKEHASGSDDPPIAEKRTGGLKSGVKKRGTFSEEYEGARG